MKQRTNRYPGFHQSGYFGVWTMVFCGRTNLIGYEIEFYHKSGDDIYKKFVV